MESYEILATQEGNNWLVKLRTDYLAHLWSGRRPIKCWPKYMEPDGRSRKKMVRVLVEENYIEDAADQDEAYPITPKVYDEIVPVKPDLTKVWDRNRNRYEGRAGKLLSGVSCQQDLDSAAQKWVLENQPEYKFYLLSPRSVLDFDQQPIPFKPGDFATWDEVRTRRNLEAGVFVTNEALESHTDNVLFEAEVRRLIGRNLSYSLVKLGLVPEDAKATFGNDDVPTPFTEALFGTDPTKWPDEMQKKISYLAESIARRATKLNHLIAAQRKIAEYGGWEKVLAEHTELIRQHLREKQQKSAESPSS